jgi:DNA-binding MarR family transcriptional regulator/predicted GNAT family acetyltransferase
MDQIDRIRAFNRLWTRAIGVLGKSYLDSGLGLAETRVLYDLDAAGGGVRARDLAQTLGIDEAQVSRILAGFERRGWLERRPADDGRVRLLALTTAGLAEAARMQQASRAAIGAMIEALPPPAREALAAGLDAAAAALGAPPMTLGPLQPGDAGWVIERHAAAYARDEGYGPEFEALVAEILAGILRSGAPARNRGWIARQGGQRLGSIFVVEETADLARLRLFYIEPSARGTGLAQRMLDEALTFARSAGYRRMTLWTHESHRAAGRIYARNGFTLTSSSPARAFGCDVVDQTWDRDL